MTNPPPESLDKHIEETLFTWFGSGNELHTKDDYKDATHSIKQLLLEYSKGLNKKTSKEVSLPEKFSYSNYSTEELVMKIRETKQVYNNDFPGHDTFWVINREQSAQAIAEYSKEQAKKELELLYSFWYKNGGRKTGKFIVDRLATLNKGGE